MKIAHNPNCTVRIGPAGWSYEDWKGIVYPPRMPRSLHPVSYLAGYFDTIEVNSTFYHPPVARNCASWVEKASCNPKFRFTAKLWERFTHKRDAWPGTAEVDLVKEGFRPMVEAEKLTCLLVQFPWSFRRTEENREWLALIAETFTETKLAVELRHTSWELEEVCEAFRDRDIAFCNIDQPLYDDCIAPCARVTSSIGYIRLHGRNYQNWFRDKAQTWERYDYLYPPDELQPWVERAMEMTKEVAELIVVTNNHYRGQAVVNAIEMAAALGEQKDTPLPQTLIDAYPRLERLAT